MSSSSPERFSHNLFRDDRRQARFEEIKDWTIIPERKVEMVPGECDKFLNGLFRRNWRKLANPLPKYDPDIVKEFYANAWPIEGETDRRSKVRGVWVDYSRDAISQFLDNPLQLEEGQQCTYYVLSGLRDGFNEQQMTSKLCIYNRGFQLSHSGRPLRILRADMTTVAQVWTTFLLANIVPLGHVSDLNVPRCQLLYCIMKRNMTVDVAAVISDEIRKFALLEINKNREKAKGALGFPALITALCEEYGVEVNPTVKIRPSINKKFIDLYCTNPADIHQAQNPPQVDPPQENHPPSAEPLTISWQEQMRLHMEHLHLQQTATYKGMLHIHQGLYSQVPAGMPNPWMSPQDFSAYVSWPGDRPIFPGGGGATQVEGDGTAAGVVSAGAGDYGMGTAGRSFGEGQSTATASGDFDADDFMEHLQEQAFESQLDKTLRGD